LGNESSVLTPGVIINNQFADRIDGGASRGANLFHSFLQFNLDAGQQVYFASPTGIENIITRVTGANPSNILGTLGVNGSANLFLINPNGILFGPNARLDLSGSFFANTASSIVFADGNQFSATSPQNPVLLTVSVPVGLQFGGTPKSIQVEGSSLQVHAWKNLGAGGR
jgi:filamentous hemagglutinin family protein